MVLYQIVVVPALVMFLVTLLGVVCLKYSPVRNWRSKKKRRAYLVKMTLLVLCVSTALSLVSPVEHLGHLAHAALSVATTIPPLYAIHWVLKLRFAGLRRRSSSRHNIDSWLYDSSVDMEGELSDLGASSKSIRNGEAKRRSTVEVSRHQSKKSGSVAIDREPSVVEHDAPPRPPNNSPVRARSNSEIIDWSTTQFHDLGDSTYNPAIAKAAST